MNKFSVILPVHNGGELVKKCIQSILLQTNTDFNLLVLDNNSNDGTSEWIGSLNDKRINLFHSSKTLTIVENWGRIKEIPKNEFITLIGHDDILLPNYLEEMERLIEKHPDASLYQAHYTYINATGEFIKYCLPMDEMQYGHEFLACQLARTIDSMGTGYMMRSKDFDALGGMPSHYPNLIYADYHLWIMLSLISYKATSEKVCFRYRVHNSISRITNGELYHQAFEEYITFIAGLMKNNPKIKSVVEKYGHDYLLFFCEALSHRILKTPVQSREIKVRGVIDKFEHYAELLIPGQPFNPLNKKRISIANQLDSSVLGRNAFLFIKKLGK